MKLLLPIALVALPALLAGCNTPPNEVTRYRDDWRAPTSAQAIYFCNAQGKTVQQTGRAPAETGILFRCD